MERAELATEEYMSYSHVLEGCKFDSQVSDKNDITD